MEGSYIRRTSVFHLPNLLLDEKDLLTGWSIFFCPYCKKPLPEICFRRKGQSPGSILLKPVSLTSSRTPAVAGIPLPQNPTKFCSPTGRAKCNKLQTITPGKHSPRNYQQNRPTLEATYPFDF
jgi:hypothetical protein